MESRHGCAWLLASAVLISVCWHSEGVPLPHLHRTGGGSGDNLSLSLFLSLAVSLSLLVALVVLLVNCVTCCKEREINFKEFEDHFDEEIDFTPPAEDTPSIQSPAEVYTLSVSPVVLPGPPHLQPPSRITEASSAVQVARHNLSYIQEIGNGWFGQVLLSEIYTDPGGTRVVVKELKANANSKEQNDFLQQGDPYRVLQHPNILQCLGQCVEAIPFLLVFEYCEMGDLRGYLSQQDWIFRNAEMLQLQRMACEIAAGVTHLHKHNFLHSDLALRNCYLTADLTVKVGDYGIGPSLYKEDYIITEDDVFAPLRWLAPELVGERHGGVVTMEQTKPSNVWALGVTLWELLESASQPYPHLSDREVLNHVIKEQQVKLFKPQLELPYADRWYEVLQFCWLQPDKRATAEEVHRLLIYLRMQGQKDMEEDFDQRWNALKPNPSARQTTVSHSSFPILDQFADDAMRQEIDEILTVTETSKGLSFEYVWEAAKQDHYEGSRSGMDSTLNYHSMFFPASSEDIQAHFPDPAAGAANAPSGTSTILPVFDAQKTSNGNEYFIQLEEPAEGNRTAAQDFNSNQKDFIVLHDVHLDESSTEADFFHQSIDSKDSYLPDSHIWSSLENDSPCHPNIFAEGESKPDDSPSWRRGFMELPERNGNSVPESGASSVVESKKNLEPSFLGVGSEALQRSHSLESDTERFLNHDKLAENYLFLREQNLMKDGPQFLSPQQNFLSPGLFHEPEETFKMKSWDNVENLGSLNSTNANLKPSSTSTRQGLLDSSSSDLDSYPSPIESGTSKVPSIMVETEDGGSVTLPESFSEVLNVLHPSDRALDSGFDSTSEKLEVTQTDDNTPAFSESAISECTDAKIPSLQEELGPTTDPILLREDPVSESLVEIEVFPSDNGLCEDQTCNDLLSELIEDPDLESTLSDHEESFMNPVRSSLLVSGPSLDQISQDSLLDDSTAPTLADTPDSLDSFYIHRLGEQGEVQNKLQPPFKIADSGYETENLESPEWTSQPEGEHSPVRNGVAKDEEPSSAGLVPPEIVISEAEALRDAEEGPPAEEPVMGSNYRDSAYFSDNESETEKKSEDPAVEVSWVRSLEASEGDAVSVPESNTLPEVEEGSAEIHSDVTPRSLNLDGSHLEFIDDDDPPELLPPAHLHAKLTRTSGSDGHKRKEPDMEGRYLGRRDGVDNQEDGVDADEEDENSEDSDEEVRGYQLHSSSSDSEDDMVHPVPVVISDDSDSKNLKSLLKPLNIVSTPVLTNNNLESSRRTVSFFDDVTVYLFDQETPTKELSDFSGPNNPAPELSSPVSTASYLNRFANSESSTDEEGGGFEWDDDFSSPSPAFISKSGRDPSPKIPSSSSAPMASGLQSSWTPASSSYSRFSISPASIASFSLTHLTDSDIEQGGSSEDGEKD